MFMNRISITMPTSSISSASATSSSRVVGWGNLGGGRGGEGGEEECSTSSLRRLEQESEIYLNPVHRHYVMAASHSSRAHASQPAVPPQPQPHPSPAECLRSIILGLLYSLEVLLDLLSVPEPGMGRGTAVVESDNRRGDDPARRDLDLALNLAARGGPATAVEVPDVDGPMWRDQRGTEYLYRHTHETDVGEGGDDKEEGYLGVVLVGNCSLHGGEYRYSGHQRMFTMRGSAHLKN